VGVPISITATVTLALGEDITTVTERFKTALNTYWLQAAEEKAVKYVFIGKTLAATNGIANYDYGSLTVNGAKDDIPITVAEFPTTGEVTLSE
jgi:uncharacterized phage protein gp47/JayE